MRECESDDISKQVDTVLTMLQSTEKKLAGSEEEQKTLLAEVSSYKIFNNPTSTFLLHDTY